MNKVVILSLILGLTGCGTIFTGSSDQVHFTAGEGAEGAKLYLNGRPYGKLPVTVDLDKSKSYNYVVKKEGYQEGYGYVQKNFNGVALLNIFFWPGFLVDVATGGLHSLEEDVWINMDKNKD